MRELGLEAGSGSGGVGREYGTCGMEAERGDGDGGGGGVGGGVC